MPDFWESSVGTAFSPLKQCFRLLKSPVAAHTRSLAPRRLSRWLCSRSSPTIRDRSVKTTIRLRIGAALRGPQRNGQWYRGSPIRWQDFTIRWKFAASSRKLPSCAVDTSMQPHDHSVIHAVIRCLWHPHSFRCSTTTLAISNISFDINRDPWKERCRCR